MMSESGQRTVRPARCTGAGEAAIEGSGERTIGRTFPAGQRALKEANAAFGEKRIGEVRAQLGRIVAMADGFVGTDEAEPVK